MDKSDHENPFERKRSGFRNFSMLIQGICRDTRRYDLILDLQALLEKRHAGLALAKGGRVRWGSARGWQHQEHSYMFLNERIPAVSMEIHALERGSDAS